MHQKHGQPDPDCRRDGGGPRLGAHIGDAGNESEDEPTTDGHPCPHERTGQNDCARGRYTDRDRARQSGGELGGAEQIDPAVQKQVVETMYRVNVLEHAE